MSDEYKQISACEDRFEECNSGKVSSCLIITYHRPWNYGAVLQALALQKALDRLGVDNLILDYRDPRIEKSRKVIRSHVHSLRSLCSGIIYAPLGLIKSKKFSDFINDNYRLTRACNSIDDLTNEAKKVELILAGSDLIWNWELNNGPDPVYFLNFAWDLEIRKASYASSIGSSCIPECYLEQYSTFLSKIDYISVREETAKKLLTPIVNKDVVNVLDPVLLHEQNFWNRYIRKVKLPEKYICAYIVEFNESVKIAVHEFSKFLHLPVVHFTRRKCYKTDEVICPTASPTEFLYILKNATYMITNSFHGVAFSILFHKNFLCIPHSTRGSRMADLLSKCELENRILSSGDCIKDKVCQITNYEDVDNNLRLLRKESYNYLNRVICRENDN